MRLRTLLDVGAPALRLLGGAEQLDRPLRGVVTTDLRDPSRYLRGGELVLTGMAWRRGPEDSEPFVRRLVAAGVAALAAGEAETGPVPEDLITACARHGLPLFAVGEEMAFATLTEHVTRRVSGERAGDLAAVLQRHQRLVAPGPGGPGVGPEAVLELLRSDLGLSAWVLAPTGRLVAGPPDEQEELPAPVRSQLAGTHLATVRAGRTTPHRIPVDDVTYSVFAIRGTDHEFDGTVAALARAAALTDWLLVVRGDLADWPTEQVDLLHGAVQLLATERDRRTAARSVPRRLAQEVLGLLRTGAPPAETAARLRVAAPVLLPGVGSVPHWQVVVARLDVAQGDPAKGDVGPAQEQHEPAAKRPAQSRSHAVSWGAVARSVLEELLAAPDAPSHTVDRCAVAHTEEEAVALVPVPAVPQPCARPDEGPSERPPASGHGTSAARAAPGLRARDLLAAAEPAFSRGLADDGRLTLGISAVVDSADGLPGRWRRHATPAVRPRRVRAASVWWATRNWPRTYCCCRSCRATSDVPSRHGCWNRCGRTTAATTPTCWAPWRSSCAVTARGRVVRTVSICTSTPFGTGSDASSSSPAGTSPGWRTGSTSSWRCGWTDGT